ncbi:MAG: hypothetical protein WC413_01530 [Candidatus Nanoarchaeia archaeon]
MVKNSSKITRTFSLSIEVVNLLEESVNAGYIKNMSKFIEDLIFSNLGSRDFIKRKLVQEAESIRERFESINYEFEFNFNLKEKEPKTLYAQSSNVEDLKEEVKIVEVEENERK